MATVGAYRGTEVKSSGLTVLSSRMVLRPANPAVTAAKRQSMPSATNAAPEGCDHESAEVDDVRRAVLSDETGRYSRKNRELV